MFRPNTLLFRLAAVLLIVLALGAPSQASARSAQSSRCGSPEPYNFVVEINDSNEGYSHELVFDFKLNRSEKRAIDCLAESNQRPQFDIYVTSNNSAIAWSEETLSSTAITYEWLHHEEYGNSLYASFRGVDPAGLKANRWQSLSIFFDSDYPIYSDELIVTVDWVTTDWREARYDGECGYEYTDNGVEICFTERNRITLGP